MPVGIKRRTFGLALGLVLTAVVAGCGGDGEPEPAPPATNVDRNLSAIKGYLLDHTRDLTAATAELKAAGEAYYAQAKAVDFDYERLLAERRDAVTRIVEDAQATHRRANPAYEEAEGVVAGVPELADFDVILDAGGSAADGPESAVPFDLALPDGRTLEKPGNFFFLTETALWGTEPKFAAKGVEPDLDGDGKVAFGEALPDAAFLLAATRDFDRYARELDTSAKAWSPTDADVFNALVVMTPTMSEYFEAWKNSRFVAGSKASESAFVGTSRLSDITDILSGLNVVYAGVRGKVASVDSQQATQTGESLEGLERFAARLRDDEADGKRFQAEEADALGSEAQGRAEAIAGQVSQAAAKLNIELEG